MQESSARRAQTKPSRFWIPLGAILLLGLAVRVAYVLAQAKSDPTFAFPGVDGAYYLEWARRLVAREEATPGAYYLAPLYPYFLASLKALAGEDLRLVYLSQHVMSLATAGLLGLVARRAAGPLAGLATAFLATFHHTFLFFASRPVAETLALLLLASSLLPGSSRSGATLTGALTGAASLARPNLLLLPLAWSAVEIARRRVVYAGLLLAGAALVILPVTLRNFVASGQLVPISSNGGITAYHGNGPGAQGTYKMPDGFSGSLSEQRQEATSLARSLSGRELDPVGADRWWGRQALRTRLSDPAGSLRLLGRRLLLLFDNHEHGLDEHPSLDRNPWRLKVRLPWLAEIAMVPFGLLLGLATVGLYFGGIEGSGGWRVWAALVVCSAAPLLFYVSSRYRMPFSAVLVVPAGCGAAGLLSSARPWGPRLRGVLLGAAVFALSLLVPSEDVQLTPRISAHYHRAAAYRATGDLVLAEAEARQAVTLGPGTPNAWYNLATILEAQGRRDEAEAAYLRALALAPGMAVAAANLASLYIGAGTPEKAPPILVRALQLGPGHESVWINLVIALWESGQHDAAREAALEAQRAGVRFDPAMLKIIGLDA